MSDEDATSAMRQKLMSADEVYVYKIPALKSAGGHRAEDWNLSTPLKTCTLVVERRADVLVMEFSSEGSLFCTAQIDCTAGQKTEQWLEQVVDSSRYFVVKIQGGGGREALVGFGFRDRDQAIDMRESIQHYERSIKRELEGGAKFDSFSVPKMNDGEKIHVNRGGKSTISKQESASKAKGSGAVPLLKKKPPSSPDTEEKEKVNPKTIDKVAISMGDIDLDAGHLDNSDSDGSSGGAVYEGDEEQWATEFAMK